MPSAQKHLPNKVEKAPLVRGVEAELMAANHDGPVNADPSRLRLMRGILPIQASEVPTITLQHDLRVFSDQLVSSQRILTDFLSAQNKYDLIWGHGYIWTHTFPFLVVERGCRTACAI